MAVAFIQFYRLILSVFGAIVVAATMVHVSIVKQSAEKQESKATKTPDSNGVTPAQNESKHDRPDAASSAAAVVAKNGKLNLGFEPNVAPNQATNVMSDNGTEADDNSGVTLKKFRLITEQNGTKDPNNTKDNSNSLKKPGLSMKGIFHFFVCNHFFFNLRICELRSTRMNQRRFYQVR